ncbi:chorismate-binding protein [Pseudonocardia sp. WMMC193]|uniref:chorismate-binding protein n=1 Tax=Pseudonocardia sp. WMMC193 TaxID=2911965 RepID=UPI001F26A6CE|nr:chorismate-binding protein [Pseudonocardia sp. WMMC193]MCF7548747.1 chorismate-binding protein [Pseudonocardia sp. WMMC193]
MTRPAGPVRAVAWSLRGAVPPDLTPAAAARCLGHRERLTAWSGAWSAGALLTCDPVPTDLVWPATPVLGGGDARVGGGWFGTVSFHGLPDMAFYPDVLRYDGEWHYEALVGPGLPDPEARCAALVADLGRAQAPGRAELEVLGLPDRTAHCIAVEECVRAVRRGEIYQANIAVHLDLHLHGSPVEAWARLVEAHAPARAGLVVGAAGAAVSASPELFLHRAGRRVRTAPIKGTRPRTGADDAGDRARLAASAKDAAENVMIVDLMRNDLSRVCTGVTVPRLRAIEPHAGVWHLVSEVEGTLAPGYDDADLLAATLPPGSVTGTPKIRAVELIERLEPTRRGLFTGALGYASPLAGLELAVAIRTLEIAPSGATRLGVGGGVTVDSTPAEEYAECLTKAGPLLRTLARTPQPRESDTAGRPVALFETILVVDGRPRRLAEHVGRVRRSWFELTGTTLEADVAGAVLKAAAPLIGRHRLRIDVTEVTEGTDGTDGTEVGDVEAGALRITSAPLGAPPPAPVLRVRRSTHTYPHKAADRAWLEAHEAQVGPGEVPLLVDADGRVLETTRHSIFALVDGVWITPPLDGRILAGTARTAFLDERPDAHPAVLTLGTLARAEAVVLTNALWDALPVRALRDETGARVAAWPAR